MKQLNSHDDWPPFPDNLPLSRGQVHVWRASLAIGGEEVAKLWDTLSPDERAVSSRFRSAGDRQHYVAARGVLRDILSRYVHSSPDRLAICRSPLGKPALVSGLGGHIRFNLSHSDGVALYAVACDREVGVDVERVRPDFFGTEVARQVLSPVEASFLWSLPPCLQPEAFFKQWTRKEAYLKARGDGLQVALDSFEVSLSTRSILRDEGGVWRIQELSVGSGYASALAAEGEIWRLCCWQWGRAAGVESGPALVKSL